MAVQLYLIQLNEVVSIVYAKEYELAEQLLDVWDEESDYYTGSTEIADVYMELGEYEKARLQFEKEWTSYYIAPYLVKLAQKIINGRATSTIR